MICDLVSPPPPPSLCRPRRLSDFGEVSTDGHQSARAEAHAELRLRPPTPGSHTIPPIALPHTGNSWPGERLSMLTSGGIGICVSTMGGCRLSSQHLDVPSCAQMVHPRRAAAELACSQTLRNSFAKGRLPITMYTCTDELPSHAQTVVQQMLKYSSPYRSLERRPASRLTRIAKYAQKHVGGNLHGLADRFGHNSANVGRIWPAVANCDKMWSTLVKLWRRVAKSSPSLAELGAHHEEVPSSRSQAHETTHKHTHTHMAKDGANDENHGPTPETRASARTRPDPQPPPKRERASARLQSPTHMKGAVNIPTIAGGE